MGMMAPPSSPVLPDVFAALDVSRWCPGARYALINGAFGTNVQRVTDQPCLLVGALAQAGATTVTLKLYNEKGQTGGGFTPDEAKRLPGVKATTFDGWVNFPVTVSDGVIATIDQSDAIAWVFYIPLPSSVYGQV